MVKRIILIIAIAMIAFSGVAMAADTANVDVTATVVGTCKFTSGGAVSFALDPAAGGPVSGSLDTPPKFWCTRGTVFAVGDGSHTYEMAHTDPAITDVIPYSFSFTPTNGTGSGKSGEVIMGITSSVAEGDYIDATAGNYSDTVQLTITY